MDVEKPSGSSPDHPPIGPPDNEKQGPTSVGPLVEKEKPVDPDLVTWDGPADPENPMNWRSSSKWLALWIVSGFALTNTMASAIFVGAVPQIAASLHITGAASQAAILNLYILAFAFGPLIFAPLSEMYGRVIPLQCASLMFFIFNLMAAWSKNAATMGIGRFLSGIGGSASMALAGGVIGDCFTPQQRGKATALFSYMPTIGPTLAPIISGFMAENIDWRWLFWLMSIISMTFQLVALVILRETHAPTVLGRKAKKLRKETGNPNLHTAYDTRDRKLGSVLKTNFERPLVMLATQPIMQVLSLWMTFVFGMLYLMITSFSALWTTMYHESVGIGGLNYVSLGIGFTVSITFCTFTADRIYLHLKARNNGQAQPEYRLPLMIPGALILPIGLFWYGWSAEARIHWIMPNIGAAIVGAGIIMSILCIQAATVEIYTRFAGSALSASNFLRSIAGYGFPLFAPTMYARLGYGWGNTMLGLIAIVIGVPAPLLLWKYGPYLRGKSKYAVGGY